MMGWSSFRVEWSEPYEWDNGRKGMVSKQVHAVCATAERAIDMVRKQSPQAVIHKVIRISTNTPTLIDSEVLERKQ